MKKNGLLLIALFLIANCSSSNPVSHENNSPEIISITVFPDIIGLSDSLIVLCNAIDPDADTLVYDWITDSRVKIKGTDNSWLYNSFSNIQVFYPSEYVNSQMETAWIQCFARDRKGKSDSRIINFTIQRD